MNNGDVARLVAIDDNPIKSYNSHKYIYGLLGSI